ncbi:MAG: DotH/IcmK family type IV secretion protein [Bdellovibrionales bacterium]
MATVAILVSWSAHAATTAGARDSDPALSAIEKILQESTKKSNAAPANQGADPTQAQSQDRIAPPPGAPSFQSALPSGTLDTSSDLAKPDSAQRPNATANGIEMSSPAPQPAFGPASDATSATTSPLNNGASSLTTDAAQLATQAEQAAMQAQARVEAEQSKREQDHNRKSYDRAASGLLPLSPDQIRSFMNKLEKTQEAAAPPSNGQPKGRVRVVTLSLDPGADPPQVDLSSGYITTINMVDATGQPWPILDVGVGGNFEVTPTQSGSHVIRIMPLTRIASGNLSVILKDLPTPVIFRLASGSQRVDLRYDARVPKYGPGAKIPLVNRPGIQAGDELIMLFLDNAPPKDAKRVKVGGLDGRTLAWSYNEKVYVRTPIALLSPAWNASASSADGMTVYEIGDAPVLLMSDNGAVVRARLSRDGEQ